MTKQVTSLLVYTGLCLHVWLFLDTSALSLSAGSDLEQLTGGQSSSSVHGQQLGIQLPTAETTDEGLGASRLVEDWATASRKDGFEKLHGDIKDGEEENGQTRGRKRSAQEEKRRLRLVNDSDRIKIADKQDARLHRHSLHKREVSPRARSTLSVANALLALTDMFEAHQERQRVLAEDNALRQRLQDVGKRSDYSVARNYQTAIREDLASLLQRAIGSSETQ